MEFIEMTPEDYTTFEISPRGEGWHIEIPEERDTRYDCRTFGDVLLAILDYRLMAQGNKGIRIDPRSLGYFKDNPDMEQLE